MNDRPWMTALEMQFAAIRVLDKRGTSYGVIDDRTSFQQLLRRAETYAWERDSSLAVVLASRTIPSTSRLARPLLPGSGIGWWWFDEPLLIAGAQVAAIVFGPAADGQIWFQCFATTEYALEQAAVQAQGDETLLARIRENERFLASRTLTLMPLCAWSFIVDTATVADFTEDVIADNGDDTNRRATGRLMIALLRMFIAGCAWLSQRIVTSINGPIERHRRKQLAREHDAPLPSDVKVIQLRRSESQPRTPGTESEPVDWSCRWIVNGHWRNQVYANDERKLIYIMPFVKGPADKPLKVPTHTVYQVNR